MGTELDKLAENNTFIIPPSDAAITFASLPCKQDTLRVPVPESNSNTFYVTQRSRKH